MIKVKLVRKTMMKGPPALKLDKATLDDIGTVVAAGIKDNILSQQQADGSALKTNAPSTRAAKRKAGLPALSLIFKGHRFIKGNSMSWKPTVDVAGNKVSVRPANQELANLSHDVQLRGYTGWFGVSAKAAAAIRARVRKFIRDALKKAEK